VSREFIGGSKRVESGGPEGWARAMNSAQRAPLRLERNG
jgi:hypothetical protein